MSYAIVSVVYGIPLNEDVARKMDEWEESGDERWDDYHGWKRLYSASGPATGYCGVELCTLESYGQDLVSKYRLEPTPKEKAKAEQLVSKINDELRDLAGPIGVYFIWSDS